MPDQITVNVTTNPDDVTVDAQLGEQGPVGPQGPAGADGYTPVDYQQVIFVGLHGDDANDGFTAENPKLTIAAAESAAETLHGTLPAGSRVLIHILDSGSYVRGGAMTIDDYTHLYGPHATIETRLVLRDSARVTLHKLFVDNSGFPGINKNSGSLNAFVHIDEIDGRGASGTITGKLVIRNQGGGGVLIVRCDRLFVPTNGVGIGDTSGGFGHIHFECEDLYLTGNNAVGIQGNDGSASIVARIGHILEIGALSGTIGIHAEAANSRVDALMAELIARTGVKMAGAGAEVNLVVGRLVCGTAWNVANGTLYMTAAQATGTKTQTGGAVNVIAASEGLVAVAPNGTRFRIDVDNAGVLSTTGI